MRSHYSGYRRSLTALALGCLMGLGLSPTLPEASAQTHVPQAEREPFRAPSAIPDNPDNPMSPARMQLGEMLFFDPLLSDSGAMSCATCHNPSLGWSDGLPVGLGDQRNRLRRRTPPVTDLAFASIMFWDGRVDTLEEQAMLPVTDRSEMMLDAEVLSRRIMGIEGYRMAFAAAYPGEPIAANTVAKALAVYQRTLTAYPSPFDRWVAGDEEAISDQAKRGFVLFTGKAACVQCHEGWRFTNDSFHDIGVKTDDIGRGKLSPEVPQLQYAFKTPGLRDVALRPPYMHNGSVPTLRAAVDHYVDGFVERPSLSEEMKRISLTDEERRALVSFLEALTSDPRPITVPRLPR